MNKRILYLEPNHLFVESEVPELEKYGKVEVITNEFDFRKAIDDIENRNIWPNLAILEQIASWANSSPEIPPAPEEIIKDGYNNAGIRCYCYLRQAEKRKNHSEIPIIFYTIIEPEQVIRRLQKRGFVNNYQCVQKDFSHKQLHEAIRKVLKL